MHVQIVKFKLKPDTSRETFIELTEQMLAWLNSADGFVTYELYEGSEYWCDRIAWKSDKHAQEGLKAFRRTATAKQMIPLVESDYSSFFGEAVVCA